MIFLAYHVMEPEQFSKKRKGLIKLKIEKISFSKENSDLIYKNYIANGFIFLKNILTPDEIDVFKKILKKKIEEILGTSFEKLLIGETQKISSKMIEKLRAEVNYRSKIFEKVPKRIFTILSKVQNKEIIFFPVNKVRINIPQINTRIFEWHQDEATWPELRNIGCHTIWVSLTHADNQNGIQIYNKKLNKLVEHINDDYLNKKDDFR